MTAENRLANFHEINYPQPKASCFWSMIERFKAEAVQVKFDPSVEPKKAAAHAQLNLSIVVDELYPNLKEMIPGPLNGEGKEFIARAESGIQKKMLSFLFEVVFSHNDLLAGNVLYVKGRADSVQLIDFEYGGE